MNNLTANKSIFISKNSTIKRISHNNDMIHKAIIIDKVSIAIKANRKTF